MIILLYDRNINEWINYECTNSEIIELRNQ